MKEIITALLKAQSEMGNAIKDAHNPFFKSKYADLNSIREAVMPILNTNGILVLQPMVHVEGKNFVKTILMHESGQMIESFTEILFKSPNDPQAQGSGITYARRYGLQSLVCIGADDDDGNKGALPPPKPTPPTPIDYDGYKEKLKKCTTVETLGAAFKLMPQIAQKTLSDYTTELKNDLIALQKNKLK